MKHRINQRAPRLRRVLAVLAPVAAVWTIVTQQTDGFEIVIQGVRLFSSRGYRNPLIITILSAAGAWCLSSPDERRALDARLSAAIRALGRPLVASSVAGVLAVGMAIFGITRGSFVAGGSDSYGYVSMARLIARGTLHVDQPQIAQASWPNNTPEAFAPVAYRPSNDGRGIVPIVAPGYPMTMALAERLAGPKAMFLVVPILGGLALFATFLIGRRFGTGIGLAGMVLLATSPSFLYQHLQPMSDVPVTAWWTLGIALVLIEGRSTTFLAGLACGMAVLTRPNLVPLTLVPLAWVTWRAWRLTDSTQVVPSRRVAALAGSVLPFSAGPVVAALAIAVINARLYGSPLVSGYGSNASLFAATHIVPNLRQFAEWTFSTETPVVVLAALAPFAVHAARRHTAWFLFAFAAVTLGCYVTYVPFDNWAYVRFLLPAFPLLLLLTALLIVTATGRLRLPLQTALVTVAIGALAWRNAAWARDHSGFSIALAEAKYEAAADFVARHLPPNAAFLSVMHSGSVRYYADRLTVRFDKIDAPLDVVLAELRRLGYQPYLLLDAAEEHGFRQRFAADRLGALDWPPVVSIERPFATAVRIYDPQHAR